MFIEPEKTLADKQPCTRVVVTGLGVLSNIGVGKENFRRALHEGKCEVSKISAFDTEGYPYAHATEITTLESREQEYKLLAKKYGRSSCLATLACIEAVNDAGFNQPLIELSNAGVILGTTNGESQVVDEVVRTSLSDGIDSIPEKSWVNCHAHSISDTVANELDLAGECMMIATACAAGNYAIGQAFDAIISGDSDAMLCGGVDSLCRKTYSGFFRFNAVTPDVCRPFDLNRKGILTGEGSAVLLLESLDHATARGAKIYAEILGYSTNCDAHHMVKPNRTSIAKCIRNAHERSGIKPEQVDFISAHGTGTPTNDVVEVGAIRDVFGADAPPTVSIKSMIGHTMGAASAMGAIACILGMESEFIPPTVNFSEADPECEIDCVPNKARSAYSSIVENHGFAFGGNNAILMMRNGQEVTL